MGFLVVEAERENAIDNLGRVLIREARGLGVADRVMCHSASLTELARLGDCAGSPEGIDCNPNGCRAGDDRLFRRGIEDVKSIHAQARGLNLAIRQINWAKWLVTFGLA